MRNNAILIFIRFHLTLVHHHHLIFMISLQNYFCLLICFSLNWAIVQAAENSLSIARKQPATSLLHDKIYFFGGIPVNNVPVQSFAYSLNLLIPFNITSPPWTKLAIENPNLTPALMTTK